jgi:serralysin
VPITVGGDASGDLTGASQIDYFTVQVVAGEKYTFQTALGTLDDSILTLLGTNAQTLVAQNDDMAPGNRASSITWQATGSGTYYLAVGSYPGTPVGTFTLSTVQVTPAPAPPTPAPNPQPPAPSPAAPSLAPIPNQTVAAGGSLTLALTGSDPAGGRLSYSAVTANGNAVSEVVYGDQLTLRTAANFSGSVQIVVTASNGTSAATQSFTVAVANNQQPNNQQSNSQQSGGSVAIPSATLPSAAGAVSFAFTPPGTSRNTVLDSPRALSAAAVDTLYGAIGR